jgi:hypothetical protein
MMPPASPLLFGVAEAETSSKHLAGLKANRWAALSEEFRTDSGERRQALTKTSSSSSADICFVVVPRETVE